MKQMRLSNSDKTFLIDDDDYKRMEYDNIINKWYLDGRQIRRLVKIGKKKYIRQNITQYIMALDCAKKVYFKSGDWLDCRKQNLDLKICDARINSAYLPSYMEFDIGEKMFIIHVNDTIIGRYDSFEKAFHGYREFEKEHFPPNLVRSEELFKLEFDHFRKREFNKSHLEY